MLKRLYIDNFRCFVNFEYKPERKQLLLGANGSGKSSLLEVIRLLKTFARDGGIPEMEETLRAFYNGRTRWQDRLEQVFEIEAELDRKHYNYRLELRKDEPSSWLGVSMVAETFKVDGEIVAQVSNGQAILYRSHGGKTVLSIQQSRIDQRSIFSVFGQQRDRGEIRTFIKWISDLPCLDLNPYAMERPEHLRGRPRLAFDLSNIGEWFRTYRADETHSESVDRLSASLREVLDGFTSIEAKASIFYDPQECFRRTEEKPPKGLPNEQQVGNPLALQVTFVKEGATVPLWFHELSDGQRTLIALYMILHFFIEKGRTVLLDEPDNFVSLREIQPWLLQAEAAADDSKGQLILISHHPEILNMWAHEYGMRMFREDGGPVQIEKYKTDYDDVMRPSEVVARGWEND